MTAATSPVSEERMNKRIKQVEEGPTASASLSIPPQHLDQSQRYPPPPPPQAQHYGVNMPPNGPTPSHMPPGGYYGGPPPPHYGSHGPPPLHHWQGGSQPPRYPSGPSPPRGMSPDRMGGSPPWSQHGGYSDSSTSKGQKSKSKRERGDEYNYSQRPPPGYQGPPPGYGPPPHWQPGVPAPPMYASQGTWTGKSPPRSGISRHRDVYRHEMDLPPYMAHGQESVDDDGASSTGESNRDKGRGSYKCGRCGVPKKGHVCPYQPKLKRRPDEPQPQTRCAAVQVEMDEFMTLRRLNIRIQGFPESYATEPYMTAEATLAIGEPAIHHPETSGTTMPPDMSTTYPPDTSGASIPLDMSTAYPPDTSSVTMPLDTSRTYPAETVVSGATLPPETYPPSPEQHLSKNGVGVPTTEQTKAKDTGVGDDPIYGVNGETAV